MMVFPEFESGVGRKPMKTMESAAVYAHDFGSCDDSPWSLRQSLMSSVSSGRRKAEKACHNGAELFSDVSDHKIN